MNKNILLFGAFLFLGSFLFAQQDTTSLIGDDDAVIDYAENAFKTNRVINAHSIENTSKGVLDFKINHRFSYLTDGAYNLFGLDGANMRIGGDYGVTDRFQVGFGRNSLNKVYDAYAKYKILRQSSGAKNMPITLCWISGISTNTKKSDENWPFTNSLGYFHQAIIGRKFSDKFSAQLMPTLVHRNLVKGGGNNNVWSVGVGLRQKVSRRLAITGEYFYVIPGQLPSTYRNFIALGVDIETGGHVFQLQLSNCQAMNERAFITETTGNFFKGNICFGFNLSRVFTVVRPKDVE